MKASEVLRNAAVSMRRYGFDPDYLGDETPDGCGCFADHIDRVTTSADRSYYDARMRVLDIVDSFCMSDLRKAGWTTEDAVAALNIAADIAEADGK